MQLAHHLVALVEYDSLVKCLTYSGAQGHEPLCSTSRVRYLPTYTTWTFFATPVDLMPVPHSWPHLFTCTEGQGGSRVSVEEAGGSNVQAQNVMCCGWEIQVLHTTSSGWHQHTFKILPFAFLKNSSREICPYIEYVLSIHQSF